MNEGRIVSTDGLDLAPGDWEAAFEEDQVGWSNALQARTHAGEVYLLGPSSRITLAGDQLHPRAAAALAATGLAERSGATRSGASWRGPSSWSMRPPRPSTSSTTTGRPSGHRCRGCQARASPPGRPRPRAGLLFHRYELDEAGRVATARIVPPTSQNQAAIEADLSDFAPSVLRPAARRGDPPLRAAHPELRPVHLVRDPFPGPARGATVMTAAASRPAAGLRQRRPRRRRRRAHRGGRSPAAICRRISWRDLDVRPCEQLEIEDLLELPDGDGLRHRRHRGRDPRGVGSDHRPRPTCRRACRGPGPSPRSSHVLPIGQLVAIAEILRAARSTARSSGIGGGSFGFGRARPAGARRAAGLPAAIEARSSTLRCQLVRRSDSGWPVPSPRAERPAVRSPCPCRATVCAHAVRSEHALHVHGLASWPGADVSCPRFPVSRSMRPGRRSRPTAGSAGDHAPPPDLAGRRVGLRIAPAPSSNG